MTLWGCTKCEITWKKLPKFEEKEPPHSHKTYVADCFACKSKTLQLSTGDAGRPNSMPQKKWDRELSAYRDARRQGIQPQGTSMEHIQDAVKASDVMGSAFNGETMGSAKVITKAKAEGMKVLDIT